MNMEGKQELLRYLTRPKKKICRAWQIEIITPIFNQKKTPKNGLTLESTIEKIYAKILEERARKKPGENMEKSQGGFRKNRGTDDKIFIRQMQKQLKWEDIDLEDAFNKIPREDVWETLERKGVEK